MGPIVSAIIPTFNRAELVVQAVESVLAQTYPKIEIIVVDDGSSDDTAAILKEYRGEIEYIYQERSERSKARNTGFRHCSGEYIAFLDSDDLWLPTKIEKQVQVLSDKPHVGLVYTDVEFVDVSGKPYTGEVSWDVPQREVLYEDLMSHNVITGTTSSVMIRRGCLEKVGLFDESMNTCEDLDLFRRIALYYECYKIDLPLVRFRVHSGSTQSNAAAMAKGWEATITKIVRETPREFEYYKNEAIIKVLYQLASLYRHDARMGDFIAFCLRSAFEKPNWILQYAFWRDLVRLCYRKSQPRQSGPGCINFLS